MENHVTVTFDAISQNEAFARMVVAAFLTGFNPTLDQMTDVTLGSDAFFPFSDNIERAHKSGVKYIAQPGGSVRDDAVIETCNKYGMVMSFTGIRLFHQ